MGADRAWRLSQPDSSGRARKGQTSEHVVLAHGSRRLELRGPGARPGARGSLAALRILQPLPQPAPSLQPPSAVGRSGLGVTPHPFGFMFSQCHQASSLYGDLFYIITVSGVFSLEV